MQYTNEVSRFASFEQGCSLLTQRQRDGFQIVKRVKLILSPTNGVDRNNYLFCAGKEFGLPSMSYVLRRPFS